MKKSLVPKPPPEPLVITSEDETKLRDWLKYFRELSKRNRLEVTQPNEYSDFNTWLKEAEIDLRNGMLIMSDYVIHDYPTGNEVAFVIRIDDSPPGHRPGKYNWRNTFFFCYGNLAFSLSQFQYDGDDNNSFSLLRFSSRDCLTWDNAKDIIVRELTGLEHRVPDPPTSPSS
jgi:hypothetical protein